MAAIGAFLWLHLRAAVFGIAILILISVTKLFWQADWPVHRYDALFVLVLAGQGALIAFGWETWREARVIFVFHIVGVVMEIFKTSLGAWVYPEEALFRIGGVPLFTGFMYSAVGSYIARFWRLSGMVLERAPPRWAEGVLAFLIYMNFYTHHFWVDIRLGLFAAVVLLYGLCIARMPSGRGVPVLAFFALAAIGVYAAENIGSLSGTWLYPNQQAGWEPVRIGKLGSWFLLMIVSFALVRSVRGDARAER